MLRQLALCAVAAVLYVLFFLAGCTGERGEVLVSDVGADQPSDPVVQSWLARLDSLRLDYVRRLYEVYNDPSAPLPIKKHTATLLGREGETPPLKWLAQEVEKSRSWEGSASYMAAIGLVPCNPSLLDDLVYSDDLDKKHAAAIIITSLAGGPHQRDLLEHLMGERERERFGGRLLVAMAMNSPWKESLPSIVHVLRSDSPPGFKYSAEIALAYMVLENKKGPMTLAEFRDYLRARLEELPEE